MNAIHARIRRYNSDIDPKSDTYRAAVLLLAALEWGQNIDVLARRTGIDRSFVAKAARRLIDNGVWAAGRTVAEWTALDEASGAFWSDVAVAEGKLCRRTAEDGSIEWAPAGYWNKGYHFVDPAVASAMTATYFNAGERPAEPVPLAAELADSEEAAAQTGNESPAAQTGNESPAAQAGNEPPAAQAGNEPPAAASEAGPSAQAPESARPEATAAEDGTDVPVEEADDADEAAQPPSLMEIFSDAVWLR